MQDNRSAELKVEGIVDKDNIEKAEVIIKEGVQAALDKLEEYQALGCLLFSFLEHLLPTLGNIKKHQGITFQVGEVMQWC